MVVAHRNGTTQFPRSKVGYRTVIPQGIFSTVHLGTPKRTADVFRRIRNTWNKLDKRHFCAYIERTRTEFVPWAVQACRSMIMATATRA